MTFGALTSSTVTLGNEEYCDVTLFSGILLCIIVPKMLIVNTLSVVTLYVFVLGVIVSLC